MGLRRLYWRVPLPQFLRRLLWLGWARWCSVCESHTRMFLSFGRPPRAGAQCPVCGSLERHRVLWEYFQKSGLLGRISGLRLLHLAPERGLQRRLRSVPGITYLSADLKARGVMIRMDVTALAHPPESFDGICCVHVLEHVESDRRAMEELYRVLAPGGWLIVMVPIRGDHTYEDSTIRTPNGRLSAFGQSDHVRRYGYDITDRLRAAGFRVTADRTVDPSGSVFLAEKN